jgi:phosphoenolpyruvate carboxylase
MLFFFKFLGNGSWSGSDNDGQYFVSVPLTALEAKLQALTFSGQLFQSFNNGVGPYVNSVRN